MSKTVLTIDDSRTMREMLNHALVQAGSAGRHTAVDEDGEPVEAEVEVGDAGRSASVLDRKEI